MQLEAFVDLETLFFLSAYFLPLATCLRTPEVMTMLVRTFCMVHNVSALTPVPPAHYLDPVTSDNITPSAFTGDYFMLSLFCPRTDKAESARSKGTRDNIHPTADGGTSHEQLA